MIDKILASIWHFRQRAFEKCLRVEERRGRNKARVWNTIIGDILITKLNTAFDFTALWLVTSLVGDK